VRTVWGFCGDCVGTVSRTESASSLNDDAASSTLPMGGAAAAVAAAAAAAASAAAAAAAVVEAEAPRPRPLRQDGRALRASSPHLRQQPRAQEQGHQPGYRHGGLEEEIR